MRSDITHERMCRISKFETSAKQNGGEKATLLSNNERKLMRLSVEPVKRRV